jgi:hypothetical protein
MKIVPEPDRLDARVPLGILAVALVTLLLSGILTVVVRWSVPVSDAASLPAPLPAGVMPAAALGGALARPVATRDPYEAHASGMFERHAAPLLTREPPQSLSSYGWVDRERRIVHIPIERAKQLYLSRQHPSGRGSGTLPVSQREGHER